MSDVTVAVDGVCWVLRLSFELWTVLLGEFSFVSPWKKGLEAI